MLNCLERNEYLVCEVGCRFGYLFVLNNLLWNEYRCGLSIGYIWNGLIFVCGSKKINLVIIFLKNFKIDIKDL